MKQYSTFKFLLIRRKQANCFDILDFITFICLYSIIINVIGSSLDCINNLKGIHFPFLIRN